MHLAWRLSIAGAVGSLVAWLISEPYAYTARTAGTVVGSSYFTLGSFFGWFAHLLFGAFAVGSMATIMSWSRMRPAKALAWGLAGLTLGGLAGWISDRESDVICIWMLRNGIGDLLMLLPQLVWSFLVAMSLAVALALTAQPTKARVTRVMMGGLAASVLGFFARLAMMPVSLALAAAATGANGHVQVWNSFDPDRLIDTATMAAVLGFSLGMAESMLQKASLRLMLGRNEGRNYPLADGVNRIGSAEGIEVPLFGDRAIQPVQAVVQAHEGGYWLQNVSPGSMVTVNGVSTTSQRLDPGDVVGIGSSRLVFELRGTTLPGYAFPDPQAGTVAPPQMVREATSVVPLQESRSRLIDGSGQVYLLEFGLQEIGRDSACPIHLTQDLSVSRRHAMIEVGMNGITVSDLGSSNGSFVNGEPIIHPRQLRDGDQVRFGSVLLVFKQA